MTIEDNKEQSLKLKAYLSENDTDHSNETYGTTDLGAWASGGFKKYILKSLEGVSDKYRKIFIPPQKIKMLSETQIFFNEAKGLATKFQKFTRDLPVLNTFYSYGEEGYNHGVFGIITAQVPATVLGKGWFDKIPLLGKLAPGSLYSSYLDKVMDSEGYKLIQTRLFPNNSNISKGLARILFGIKGDEFDKNYKTLQSYNKIMSNRGYKSFGDQILSKTAQFGKFAKNSIISGGKALGNVAISGAKAIGNAAKSAFSWVSSFFSHGGFAFHSGGVVPGRGEVMAILKGGETVRTEEQEQALQSALSRKNASSSGESNRTINRNTLLPRLSKEDDQYVIGLIIDAYKRNRYGLRTLLRSY